MSAFGRLCAKELRVELRSRETLLPVLLVAFLVVAVGLLSFHEVGARAAVASGVLWTGLAFAASLGLARAFGAERDRGTLDTLLTLPVDRSGLYLAKAVAGFLTILVVGLVVLPAYLVVSGDPWPPGWPALLALLVLGAAGLAATGTLLSVLAAQTRTRDLLLPVLLLPLLVPLLIAAVHGTLDVLGGAGFASYRPELMLLAGYDVAFLAASSLLFETAVGA